MQAEKYYDKVKHQDSWNVDVIYPADVKKIIEISQIEGILIGLSIAKKAWDKGHGRDDIYENEIAYREQLENLLKEPNIPSV